MSAVPLSACDTVMAYMQAYARKDLSAVAAMLAEGVELRDWNLAASGKPAVLAETKKNFDGATSIEIEVLALYPRAEAGVAAELHICVNGDIHLKVVDVIDLNADGHITAIRAYKG